MVKFKRIAATVLSLQLVAFAASDNIPVMAKADSVPKLKMVTQPVSEYKPGERISFTVTSPNYGGKVEYRVILWNGTTKKTSELWNTQNTGYYYKDWQPAGNYNFTIQWPVQGMEAGAYSLTVLVRRVGAKGTYDSFTKTNTFWVKSGNVEEQNTEDADSNDVPKVQIVTQPSTEYKIGDKISATFNIPNYNGKIEYRAILWNGTTNKEIELWNTPETGFYFRDSQYTASSNIIIEWPKDKIEPGVYSMSVLVRREGKKDSYDSIVKTKTFWVRSEPTEKLTSDYYESQNGKFKIKLPVGWLTEEKDTPNAHVVTARPDINDNSEMIILTGKAAPGSNLDTAMPYLFNGFIKDFSSTYTTWNQLDRKNVAIANQEAYLYEYAGTLDKNGSSLAVGAYVLYTVNNDTINIVLIKSSGENWIDNSPAYEQVISSFIPAGSTSTK